MVVVGGHVTQTARPRRDEGRTVSLESKLPRRLSKQEVISQEVSVKGGTSVALCRPRRTYD